MRYIYIVLILVSCNGVGNEKESFKKNKSKVVMSEEIVIGNVKIDSTTGNYNNKGMKTGIWKYYSKGELIKTGYHDDEGVELYLDDTLQIID